MAEFLCHATTHYVLEKKILIEKEKKIQSARGLLQSARGLLQSARGLLQSTRGLFAPTSFIVLSPV